LYTERENMGRKHKSGFFRNVCEGEGKRARERTAVCVSGAVLGREQNEEAVSRHEWERIIDLFLDTQFLQYTHSRYELQRNKNHLGVDFPFPFTRSRPFCLFTP
jgi:hypothetical protein